MSTRSDTPVLVVGCFGLIVLAAFILVVSSILNGWVLSVMWGWFVVPLFDLPQMSIPTAIGISMVAAMLTHQSNDSKEDKDKKWSDTIAKIFTTTFLVPLLTLFVGWIVHLFL